MNLPNLPVGSDAKILQLINEAPGNFFSLEANGAAVLPAKFYKDSRPDFLQRLNTYLLSDLSADGVYTINNGTTRKVRPIFYVQKGISQTPATIPMKEDKSNIELVKENAELKAKLHYLQKQFDDLSADLEETEADLEEAPVSTEKNPWHILAENLAPVAGQLLAAMCAKYLQNDEPQNRPGTTSARPVEVRHARPNVTASPGAVQNQQPNNTVNLQGDDYSGAAVRNFNS